MFGRLYGLTSVAAVRTLVSSTMVLLTSQHLEEADHIAVIDPGRVIADGSPEELNAGLGDDRIEVVVRRAADLITTITGATPLSVRRYRQLSH